MIKIKIEQFVLPKINYNPNWGGIVKDIVVYEDKKKICRLPYDENYFEDTLLKLYRSGREAGFQDCINQLELCES